MGLEPRSRTLTRETAPSPSPPAAFGRFRVVHQVGAGAHGPVFLATDPDSNRQVAIKVFPLAITPEQAADLAAAFERLAGAPLGHPSIVAPLAAGAEGSTVYLVEDYVLAESVDVAIRQYGPAPVPDALRLVGQLAGALDFAAVAGVHHGALHPRDVLVAPNDVRLTGLGVVEALAQVGVRVKPRRPYSAPERHEDEAWGTAADVFSLATLGFELLTGRRPGSAEALAADAGSIAAPDPASLAEVFGRALAPRPEDRYQTALAFAAALRHALTGEPLDRPDVVALPGEPGAPAEDTVTAAAVEAEAPREAAAELAPMDLPPFTEERDAGEGMEQVELAPLALAPVEEPDQADVFRFEEEPEGHEGRREEAEEAAEEEPVPAGPRELGEEESFGPRDLGEESEGAAAGDELLLPLEPAAPPPAAAMRQEEELPSTRERPVQPRVPLPPATAGEPGWRQADARQRARRGGSPGRFGLSSLLAMLLIGVLGGFTLGYLTGVREAPVQPGAAGDAAALPATTPEGGGAAATPVGSDIALSPEAEPQAPATVRPETSPGPASGEAPAAAPPAPARPTAPPASQQERRAAVRFEAPLSVVSRPPGAMVRLDGRAIGKTPLNMSAVGAGSHVVRLELDGYLPWTSAIQVVTGRQNRVTASLERRSGRIE